MSIALSERDRGETADRLLLGVFIINSSYLMDLEGAHGALRVYYGNGRLNKALTRPDKASLADFDAMCD